MMGWDKALEYSMLIWKPVIIFDFPGKNIN